LVEPPAKGIGPGVARRDPDPFAVILKRGFEIAHCFERTTARRQRIGAGLRPHIAALGNACAGCNPALVRSLMAVLKVLPVGHLDLSTEDGQCGAECFQRKHDGACAAGKQTLLHWSDGAGRGFKARKSRCKSVGYSSRPTTPCRVSSQPSRNTITSVVR